MGHVLSLVASIARVVLIVEIVFFFRDIASRYFHQDNEKSSTFIQCALFVNASNPNLPLFLIDVHGVVFFLNQITRLIATS